jgi:type IV secretion system protein VirB5
MRFKKIIFPFLLCLGLGLSSQTYASEFTEIMNILGKTYGVDVNLEDIQGAMQGLSEDQLDAITRNYGYGDILNSDDDLEKREWSADTWDDALQGLSGGNSDRYQELLNSYQQDHPSLEHDEVAKGSTEVYATDYQQMVNTNQAANVHASYAFEEVNKHLETINELSKKIEEAENTKAIADLTARINAEIAYLQVEQIKAISVMNEQLAQGQASEIVNRSEASKFNQVPEE